MKRNQNTDSRERERARKITRERTTQSQRHTHTRTHTQTHTPTHTHICIYIIHRHTHFGITLLGNGFCWKSPVQLVTVKTHFQIFVGTCTRFELAHAGTSLRYPALPRLTPLHEMTQDLHLQTPRFAELCTASFRKECQTLHDDHALPHDTPTGSPRHMLRALPEAHRR